MNHKKTINETLLKSIIILCLIAILIISFIEIKKDKENKIESVSSSSLEIIEMEEIIPEEPKEELIDYINLDAPKNNTIKSYMDYRTITAKSSRQYQMQEALAYTGEDGLRMVEGRYCVALGSYYTTTIGQYVDIILENGQVIEGILADCKADNNTDETNRIHPDGSVVEFVVDTKVLDKFIKKMGDISYMYEWKSKVAGVKVYDKFAEF